MAVTRADIIDVIKRRFGLAVGDTTLVRAINEAIRSAEHWLVPTTDTSTVTIADETYSYTLPTDLVQLLQVWTREDSDQAWLEVAPHRWQVNGTPGAQELYLHSLSGLDAGDTVRLEYLARLNSLDTDAATLDIGPPMEAVVVNYITEYALHLLHEASASKQQTDGGDASHSRKAEGHYRKAMGVLSGAMRGRPAGRMHGSPFPDSKG